MHDIARKDGRPWYREPWPWILIAGPAAVVVASFFTLYLAVASSDGLVDEDYYRDGLAINRVLAREDAAQRLGLAAEIDPRDGVLRLRLQGGDGAPAFVTVRLVHATRAGYDRSVTLERAADGSYRAALPALPPGHWRIAIEDPRRQWRLAGEWLDDGGPFLLEARAGIGR